MPYLQKIFYNDKPFIFTDSSDDCLKKYPQSESFLVLKGSFNKNYESAKEYLKKATTTGVMLVFDNKKALLEEVDKAFTHISAAGGLATTPKGKMLLIFRNGKWDLPKGKLEDNETIPDCAIREVSEETGLPIETIKMEEEVGQTLHIYSLKDREILKTTYWFAMKVDKEWPLTPQTIENIGEAKWLNKKEVSNCLKNIWQSIAELILDYQRKN